MSDYSSEDDAAFRKKGKVGLGLGVKKLESEDKYDSPSPNKMQESSPDVQIGGSSKFDKIKKNSSEDDLSRDELSNSS